MDNDNMEKIMDGITEFFDPENIGRMFNTAREGVGAVAGAVAEKLGGNSGESPVTILVKTVGEPEMAKAALNMKRLVHNAPEALKTEVEEACEEANTLMADDADGDVAEAVEEYLFPAIRKACSGYKGTESLFSGNEAVLGLAKEAAAKNIREAMEEVRRVADGTARKESIVEACAKVKEEIAKLQELIGELNIRVEDNNEDES